MKKTDNIYYLGLILLIIKMWFFITTLFEFDSIIENTFTIAITLVFGLKIFLTKNNYKEFLIIAVISVFIFITSQAASNVDIFLSVLSILAAKNIDFKKAIRCILVVNLIIIIIHVIYFVICYFFDPDEIEYIYGDDNSKRYTFFMRHPNYLGATILWTLSAYIYLHFDKRRKNILLIILSAILVYFSCKSRTTLLGFVVLLFLLMIINKINTKTLAKITKWAFFIAILLSIFVVSNYYNFTGQIKTIVNEIDTMISHRISLSAAAMDSYGYTFLGRYIDRTNEKLLAYYGIKNELIIDSFYISCCVNYGIFYLVLMGIGLIKICKVLDKKELVFLLLFIVVSLMERYVIYSTLVFPLIFFAKLYNAKERKDEKT